VHELDPDQRGVGRCQRREAEHGTRDPFDGMMILFNHTTLLQFAGLRAYCI
jgi:hypothetical protein